MKLQNIVILFVVICFIFWLNEWFLDIYYSMNSFVKPNSSLTYFKFHQDFSHTNTLDTSIQLFKNVFAKHDIHYINKFRSSNIVFFHLIVNYIPLRSIVQRNKHVKFIYSLLCIDRFASKSELAMILKSHLSEEEYLKLSPVTYTFPIDQKRLENNFDRKKIYILKKNLQRQKGCLITNTKSDILESNVRKEKYVVCQELLINPYCVDGHKINVRRYLLITIKATPNLFLYNEGFMYYAPDKFSKTSLSHDVHITTGYIDRKIYEKNPLTYTGFLQTLSESEQTILETNMIDLFTKVHQSYSKILTKEDGTNKHQMNFMICGCDIAVDEHLGCKLMEINKGPDLSGKDDTDTRIKTKLIEDTLHIVGVITRNNSYDNYVKIN